MLTYVINTSENRTLDNDRLFELAGYNKIRWMNCRLSEIQDRAQEIYEKQNLLGMEQFRIAVIVDFFGFDRVRVPYGRLGFRPEIGVDISLYMPYIETFLLDNLILYLEKRELHASDFEVYYVQNAKLERYEFLSNAKEQLHQILSGCEDGDLKAEKIDPPALKKSESEDDELKKKKKKKDEFEPEPPEEEEVEEVVVDPNDLIAYPAFEVYCTPSVKLTLKLSDYPYGAEKMTFSQFYDAFFARVGLKNMIRRHYYVSSYGGGQARAAFDTLSLSLYLIRMYERGENFDEEGELEIVHIDPDTLKDILVTAWVKINLARNIAKGNNSTYFSLSQNTHIAKIPESAKEESDLEALAELYESGATRLSGEELYRRICYYHERTPEQVSADNREEFNHIMDDYLERRDETREASVEQELEEKIREDMLITTSQFPSKEEYIHLVGEKQDEISARFEKALAADYIAVDYTEERKRADKAFENYSNIKACLHRNIIGDIIFMVLALLAVLGPYAVLQLSGHAMKAMEVLLLMGNALTLFGGLFVAAILLQIFILSIKLSRAKDELRYCYNECYKKNRESMSEIRRRYRDDLIYIERTRYEIRQLNYLYNANLAKDANVKRHREMLEEVEDRLSSILNNLDVEPVLDNEETVYGEFDMTKPIRARENKVYKIFSIDAIDRMIAKQKGRVEK